MALVNPGPGRRVLIIGPVTPTDGGKTTGGVATHVSDLARALADLGWKVAVYGDNMPPADDPVQASWGQLWPPARLRTSTLLSGTSVASAIRVAGAWRSFARSGHRFTSVLSNVLGIRRAAKAHRPDVYHYHHAELRPLFGRLAKVAGPSVITAHSLSAFRDPNAAAMQRLAAHNLAQADAVICVSDDAASALAGLVPGIKPYVVPNGIDVAAFATAPSAPPWQGSRPLVLYLGWLAEYKGVRDLAHAMRIVRSTHPGATLAFVGPVIDVTAEAAAEEAGLTCDAWTAPGAVGPEDVRAWLHEADVLVLPSRVREGQPRVLIEAMAAGTPIIATDVGGVRALLSDGAYGTLVPPGEQETLAEGIRVALEHTGETAQRSAAAKLAVQGYDTAAVSPQVAKVYELVLARKAER